RTVAHLLRVWRLYAVNNLKSCAANACFHGAAVEMPMFTIPLHRHLNGLNGMLLNRRNTRPQSSDALPLHLRCPRRVDGLWDPDAPKIQLQVGYKKPEPVLAEGGTCRKQQTVCHAILNTVEVAELGNSLSGGIYHHDLISLIGRHPKVIVV